MRPAPINPAMPSISPARTSKPTSLRTSRPGFSGSSTDQPVTASIGLPAVVSGRGYRFFTSRPTISEITRSWVACLAGWVAIERPSRSTVMRSAIWNTSSRRWLM